MKQLKIARLQKIVFTFFELFALKKMFLKNISRLVETPNVFSFYDWQFVTWISFSKGLTLILVEDCEVMNLTVSVHGLLSFNGVTISACLFSGIKADFGLRIKEVMA